VCNANKKGVQTETQTNPEFLFQRNQSNQTSRSPSVAARRPGGGRKPNPANILLKGTSRATLLHALENVDPQLVSAKITKLLQSKREIIWLQTLNFI
jgi:hypothetical protein